MTHRFVATYYDGRTAGARHVEVDVLRGGDGRPLLRFATATAMASHPLAGLRIHARIGQARRLIELPDGGSLEVAADAGLDAALDGYWTPGSRGLSALESRWPAAIAAAVVAVAGVWAILHFAVPVLAGRAVTLIPAEVDARIGGDGLALLDRRFLQPSRLDAARLEQLRESFAAQVRDLGVAGRARVVFRGGGPLGANAFALPAGTVVVTDELVELSRHDDELRAVFAHEIGHVVGRHAMRRLLQSSVDAVLLVGLLGDVSAASSLTASIPTVLAEAANSREFEREADDFARAWMRGTGVPASRMGDLLQRVEERYGKVAWSYLATHPPLEERLRD